MQHCNPAYSIGDRRAQERSLLQCFIHQKRAQGWCRLKHCRAISLFTGSWKQAGTGLPHVPKSAACLVDKNLMLTVQCQSRWFSESWRGDILIAGRWQSTGSTGFSLRLRLRLYSLSYLDSTGLQQKGSRLTIVFSTSLINKLSCKTGRNNWTKTEKDGFDFETVESRKRNTGRTFEDFTSYRSLVYCFGTGLHRCCELYSSLYKEEIMP